MSDKKALLLALQQELSERIAKIDSDIHSRKSSSKFSEQVVDRQNDDVLLNLKNEAQAEIQQIEHALLKMQNDQYGTCEKCHGEISDARLEAVPFASRCKKCAA